MSEKCLYSMAFDIAKQISDACETHAEATQLIKLLDELLDIRYAILSPQS